MLENNGGYDVQLQEPCPDKSCAVQFSGFSTSLVNPPNFLLPFKLPPPPHITIVGMFTYRGSYLHKAGY